MTHVTALPIKKLNFKYFLLQIVGRYGLVMFRILYSNCSTEPEGLLIVKINNDRTFQDDKVQIIAQWDCSQSVTSPSSSLSQS